MGLHLSIKAKLVLAAGAAQELKSTVEEFNRACDTLSELAFQRDLHHKYDIHHDGYRLIGQETVAGLMLGRVVARRKEMAVRLALGAGRLRLVRQLLTESLLLAALGGLFGVVFAWWGTRLFLPLISQGDIPPHLSFNPDLRMLGFTAAVTTLTGVLFGLAPAFLATHIDLQSALKQDSQGMIGRTARLSFGHVFVIAQVALSLLLLVGAGLFVRSLQKLQQVDTGFARENALVLKLEPVGSDNGESPRLTARYDELLRRVEALPGVRQASLSSPKIGRGGP